MTILRRVICSTASHRLLELTISSDRKRYKQNDKIRIDVTLTNQDYVKEIFVYGTLGWGYRASLREIIRDARGKRISPKIFSDDLTPPVSRNDLTPFVKLLPRHFLGTYFVQETGQLNLSKPGRYSIVVEYHCPISATEVDLVRIFGAKKTEYSDRTLSGLKSFHMLIRSIIYLTNQVDFHALALRHRASCLISNDRVPHHDYALQAEVTASVHTFRHYRGTYLLCGGASVRHVQQIPRSLRSQHH